MMEIKINLSEAARESLLKLQILELQMGLMMDIIEEWHGIMLDRKAVFQEMKNRIARMRRAELIKPVEGGKSG
ncbi:MAG: hypothetical protein ABIN58_12720 [candidate division WOR-3 bacterium]